jgi:hypothetical protein
MGTMTARAVDWAVPALLMSLFAYKAGAAAVPFMTALHGTLLLPLAALLAIAAQLTRLRGRIAGALLLAGLALLLLAIGNEMLMLLGLIPRPATLHAMLNLLLALTAFVAAERVVASLHGESPLRGCLAPVLLVPLLALAQRLEHGAALAPYHADDGLLLATAAVPVSALMAAARRRLRDRLVDPRD